MSTLHPGQLDLLRNAARFNVAACGRRFGKTALAVTLAVFGWPACANGLVSGCDVGWFAPNYKLLDDAWRICKRVLSEQGVVERTDTQQKRLEVANGAALDFWTLEDADAGRGRRYGLLIVDEAAMARKLQEAWEQAMRPTLTDLAGGAWFFSTPKGRNYFWQLHQRGGDPRWKEWVAHHAPSAANPHLRPAEIEAARTSLPERVFAQEYLAQFLEDAGGVFRRVTEAVDPALAADAHSSCDVGDGRAYVIGVDWGRHHDFTVFVVLDARDRAVVAVDRFTDIDYAIQLARLKALRSRFPHAPVLAESNSMGGPLIEQLRAAGMPVVAFQTTAASKAQAIEALALAFEQGAIRIPSAQWLVDELLAFDQERMASGAMRYGAPPGGFDDGVMALAIAWHGMAAQPGRVASAGRRFSYPLPV